MIKVSDPDILLAASLPLADRQGRRVIRCVELTPGEEEELRRRIRDMTGDMLVALPGFGKRGRR